MPYASERVASRTSASARWPVGRAADLVAHHLQLVAVAREAEHRVHEVLARDAEEPRRAHHEVALVRRRHRVLAGELRAAVGGPRPGGVGLDVGRALRAVEHVVGGGLHDGRAHCRSRRHVSGRRAVQRRRGLLFPLRAVDVGVGRAVDDHVRGASGRRARRTASRSRSRRDRRGRAHRVVPSPLGRRPPATSRPSMPPAGQRGVDSHLREWISAGSDLVRAGACALVTVKERLTNGGRCVRQGGGGAGDSRGCRSVIDRGPERL